MIVPLGLVSDATCGGMIEGTCRHKALSARRRRTEGAELDEKIEATIADPANDPEVALQEKDRGELLRRALTRLSPDHRQVIDLVYYHEKSVDEVAHILDVPPATVKHVCSMLE